MHKIAFFLLALMMGGCGPESDEVRYWTLGAYFAVMVAVFLACFIHRLITRRYWINPLECISNGIGLAGITALCASPFYGYAEGTFGGFAMLFILGIVGLLIFKLLDA